MKTTVAQYIIDYLQVVENVKHIFTVVGGGCIFLEEALRKSNIKPVFCLKEQGAAIAAEAYSQAGGLGVALVTTGPGVTNALTGVAGGYLESTPMLVISGQVNTFHSASQSGVRQRGFQELRTDRLVSSIVKEYVCVQNSDQNSLDRMLNRVLYAMRKGRPGPVWIDIPLDIQNQEIEVDGNYHADAWPQPNIDWLGWEEDVWEHLIQCLKEAKRPICLAGNGIRLAGMEEQFKELVHELNLPVLCTWKTFDMFNVDDRLYAGRPGIVTSRYANKLQQESDLFISFGARLDLGQVAFNYPNFAPSARKIIFDVDERELTKWIDIPKAGIYGGHLKYIIPKLLDHVKRTFAGYNPDAEWPQYCELVKQRNSLKKEHAKDRAFNFYKVLPYIADGLTNDNMIVHGSSGTCSEATCQALEPKIKTRVIGTHGLGSMGFGVPAAIGAHYATGKQIICIEGDGSLTMNLQELQVLLSNELPICIIVLNNNGYASIRNTQDKLFKREQFGSGPSSGLELPNNIDIASTFGLNYHMITDETQLTVIPHILQHITRPTMIEVFVDSHDTVTYPRTHTKVQADGTITTMPMEDLWPERD